MESEFQPIISLNSVQTPALLQERGSNEEEDNSSSSSTNSRDVAFSFSSDSSSDDFIQVDHPILIIPPKPPEENENDEESVVVSNLSQLKLEELFLRSSSTNSRISDVTIESYIPDVSPTQSPPPLQVMEKTMTSDLNFDPERIPASIFGKPSSPLDWSVASNESLFSIHIGNYSFAHDRMDSIDECYSFREMHNKSGELMNNSNSDSNNVVVSHDEANNTQKAARNVVNNTQKAARNVVNIPKKSMNDDDDDLKVKAIEGGGGFEGKKDNCRGTGGLKVQSYPHPIKQSRCSCEWLTCQRCSCKGLLLLCCWPRNCCSKCDICSSSCCSNFKCFKWWNCCCCCSTTSSWTCSFRQIFCCFSNQRSSKAASKPVTNNKCKCCFTYPCCCN